MVDVWVGSDRRVDGLRSLLKFYEALIDDVFQRVEALEPVISKDLQGFPYLFHHNVRKSTLEVLRGFNSRVAEFAHEEDLSVATMNPEERHRE